MDDLTIMAQIIAGDTGKMAILYERYKMALYGYFFRVTLGDRETSEDLVHTVFYRALKYKNSFRGSGSFAKWLFRIAHNTAVDHNRRIKNLDNYKAETISATVAYYEENGIEKREELSMLDQALKSLEASERELIVLGKIDCLKYREIAEITGISEANVKIRMFRALKKLKDIFLKLENQSNENW